MFKLQNINDGTGSCTTIHNVTYVAPLPPWMQNCIWLRLATMFKAQTTGARAFLSLPRPYDKVAQTMGMTVREVNE